MSNAVTNKKILFIAPTAYPFGGVAVWLHYLLSGLNQIGWNVSFGAVEGKFHDVSEYLEHYKFANLVPIANPTATKYGRVHAIAKVIEKNQFDLVISVNIPDAYRAIRQLRAKGNNKVRMVATIHGLVPQLFQDISTYGDVIDAVVVTNRLTQKMVAIMTDVVPENIFYAPYGVELGAAREINPHPGTLRILYSGRIENEQKRCADLIQIMAKLEQARLDYVFTIAGDGPFRDELIQKLSSIVPADKLEYLGFVAADQLHQKVYRESDILLLTSEWETGPMVILEAMTQGVVVVTSRYKGSRSEGSLLHGSNCLMFDVGDTAGAAEQIQSLVADQRLTQLAAAGIQLVENRYSRSKSISAWELALTKILEGPAPAINHKVNLFTARGTIEKLFGSRFGHKIRHALNRPAHTASAGDEWPHTHADLNTEFVNRFQSHLHDLD